MWLQRVCAALLLWQVVVAAGQQTDENCKGKAGEKVCDSTSQNVIFCLDGGKYIVMENCSGIGYCSNAKCVEQKFVYKCGAKGTFPDLADCTKYYKCANSSRGIAALYTPEALANTADGVQASCTTTSEYYDDCTGQCDVKNNGSKCSWLTNDFCKDTGNFHLAPNNDRLYYICVHAADEIQVIWFRCEYGFYSLESHTCVNLVTPGCRK